MQLAPLKGTHPPHSHRAEGYCPPSSIHLHILFTNGSWVLAQAQGLYSDDGLGDRAPRFGENWDLWVTAAIQT